MRSGFDDLLFWAVWLPGTLGSMATARLFISLTPSPPPAHAVCYVTNLNDSGPSSFRDCVERDGVTVVLDVSGVIPTGGPIDWGENVTALGQKQ